MTSSDVLVIISGLLKDIPFLIDGLKIEEYFCSPLYGELILFSTQEIVCDQILNNRISIEIDDNRTVKRYFHGLVVECIFKGIQTIVNRNCYVYLFKFASFLHFLKNNIYFRIFAHKTIQEVIECLLEPYLKCVIVEIQIQDRKVRNYIQYDVTDFDFLHQLFRRYQIFYFFKVTESIETIIITDHNEYWVKPISFCYDKNSVDAITNWQERYKYGQPDKISAASHCILLNAGSIFKKKRTASKQWVVKYILHQFRGLTFINQHSYLISAIYENKFHAVDKESFKAWENISFTKPRFFGIEKAMVMNHENIFLQIMCPRTQNKARVSFMRSELRQNKDLCTSFVPQDGQIVIVSFEAEQLTEGIIFGGLFKTNQSWPFDMDKEGISISSEETQQSFYFDRAGLTIQSSGHFNQNVHHNLVTEIDEEGTTDVAQSMRCQCDKGSFCIEAKAIKGQVGSTCFELNQKGITVRGEKIFLN